MNAYGEEERILSYQDRRDYLHLDLISRMLSSDRFTHLELYLCGTGLLCYGWEERYGESHVCKIISGLVSTLKCLKLRMRAMCTDFLDTEEDDDDDYPMEETIIN